MCFTLVKYKKAVRIIEEETVMKETKKQVLPYCRNYQIYIVIILPHLSSIIASVQHSHSGIVEPDIS